VWYNNSMGMIYQIRNTTNNKRYIGSTTDWRTRWKHHKSKLKNNRHENRYLQNAANKYGYTAFVFEPLMLCHDLLLTTCEQWFLDNEPGDYNINPLADKPPSRKGVSLKETTKKKLVDFNKGKVLPDWHKEKIKASAPRGEDHKRSKLTNEDVFCIRELHRTGECNASQLASIFNVAKSTTARIIKRKSWRHI
jgi:group I intron endonuclease